MALWGWYGENWLGNIVKSLSSHYWGAPIRLLYLRVILNFSSNVYLLIGLLIISSIPHNLHFFSIANYYFKINLFISNPSISLPSIKSHSLIYKNLNWHILITIITQLAALPTRWASLLSFVPNKRGSLCALLPDHTHKA